MAVEMPPVIPPALADAAMLREFVAARAGAPSAELRLSLAGKEALISGNRYLSEARIRQVFAAASSIEQGIKALSRAYYDAGQLLVRVFYADTGAQIRVHVVNAAVADIEAPAEIGAYFTALVGDSDLTAAEFERRRVVAAIKSERSGVDYTVSYETAPDPRNITIKLAPVKTKSSDSRDLIVTADNAGNRFIGRYFGGLLGRQAFDHGGEVSFSVNTLLDSFGSTADGKSYNAGTLAYNLVRPHGLYGVEIGYSEYTRSVTGRSAEAESATGVDLLDTVLPTNQVASPGQTIDLDTQTQFAQVSAEQLWYAFGDSRFSTMERLKFSDHRVTDDSGQALIDETNTTFELGALYTRAGERLTLNMQAFLDIGLNSERSKSPSSDMSGGDGTVFDRSADAIIFRPQFSAFWQLSDNERIGLQLSGQLVNDKQLAEQRQYVLGGPSALAAWLPGVLVGDSGYHAAIALETARWQLWGQAQKLIVFAEAGGAGFEGSTAISGDALHVADAGLRLLVTHPAGLSSELVVAQPLKDGDLSESRARRFEADFLWRLSWQF